VESLLAKKPPSVPVFLDYTFFLDHPGACAGWLESHPGLKLVLAFDAAKPWEPGADRATGDLDGIRAFLARWPGRLRIGADLKLPAAVTSAKHVRDHATRRLLGLRNYFELPRFNSPVLDSAHLEWGYPYDQEKDHPGLALPPAALRPLYGN
jgi:hypothetical protein